MNEENRKLAKQIFEMINGRIGLLRIEMDLLEVEGNGLREISEKVVGRLEQTAVFNEASLVNDANNAVHQKWAEQAQRYNLQANAVAKILLEKSRQMLDLVQFLKKKLREFGFEVPEEDTEFLDWDDILFEKEQVEYE